MNVTNRPVFVTLHPIWLSKWELYTWHCNKMASFRNIGLFTAVRAFRMAWWSGHVASNTGCVSLSLIWLSKWILDTADSDKVGAVEFPKGMMKCDEAVEFPKALAAVWWSCWVSKSPGSGVKLLSFWKPWQRCDESFILLVTQ